MPDTPHRASPEELPKRQSQVLRVGAAEGAQHQRKRKRNEAERSRPASLRHYIALVMLTVAAFAPAFFSDLLRTDYDSVERSPYESMERWTEAWSPEVIRQHDPLTLTSYFLETALPLAPAPTHRAINLSLHLATAFLLLKVFECLRLPGAFAAALIFALHPAVTQTVFWPDYRHEIMGLLFLVASLFFGIRNRDFTDFFFASALAIVATIIHPVALALPLIFGLCIFLQSESFRLSDYSRILPFVCIALFVGLWTLSSMTPPGLDQIDAFAEQSLSHFFRQALFPFQPSLFLPFDLSDDHGRSQNRLLLFLSFLSFYVLFAFNARKRLIRAYLLGCTALLPMLFYGVLLQPGRFIDGSPAKETHAFYPALPLVVALVICSAAAFFHRFGPFGKHLWLAASGLFTLALFGVTASFNYHLSEDTRLWKTLSEQWPDSWQAKVAFVNSAQSNAPDLLKEEALIGILQDILEQNPARVEERKLLARAYREADQNTNALREYKNVVREANLSDEFLEEAATFFDQLGLRWEATKVRKRIATK